MTRLRLRVPAFWCGLFRFYQRICLRLRGALRLRFTRCRGRRRRGLSFRNLLPLVPSLLLVVFLVILLVQGVGFETDPQRVFETSWVKMLSLSTGETRLESSILVSATYERVPAVCAHPKIKKLGGSAGVEDGPTPSTAIQTHGLTPIGEIPLSM